MGARGSPILLLSAAAACGSSSAPLPSSMADAATSDAATATDARVMPAGSLPDGSASDASDGGSADGAAAAFTGTISYAAFGSDGFTHIFTVTSGSVTTQLTAAPGNDETAEWSPDGSLAKRAPK